MELEQARARYFLVEKPSENTQYFGYKTSLYQNKTIFITSFLHYDVTMVITFYTLIFNTISTICHLVYKAFEKT